MRKTKPKKRILLPDPRYNDPYVTRFVNNMMLNGKKSKAYDIFYEAMDILANAHALLRERATKISDEALRRSFLENVPEHREIVSEYERWRADVAEEWDRRMDDGAVGRLRH